jgi:four helix bundle protein
MSDHSIAGLRIYQQALQLEDSVYVLAKKIPTKDFYPLGNDLRRASAAVSYHITDSHKRYSYKFKIESLHAARQESEETITQLKAFQEAGRGKTDELVEGYTAIIKQSWGLIKYFNKKQLAKQTFDRAAATDELVAARS